MPENIKVGIQAETKQAESDIKKLTDAINALKTTIQGLGSSSGLDKMSSSAKNSAKDYMASVRKMADASQKAQQAMMKEQYQSAFKAVDRGNKYQLEQAKEQARIASEQAKASRERAKAVADQLRMATESSKSFGKDSARSFADFKSAIKGIDYPLKNFTKSLMRIAKLRLLRGIIRSITGAFKEGLSNIYQYSAAMNNLDASHMKGSMDSLASSLLFMKNAVASAVAPLIAQLVPVIAQVANWFVTAASAVAQFFAALGGATTYTRAKKEAVEWGNVASGAGGAAAAAQEYKNTILGFDEIHALNDVPSGGGGGGGGGGGTPDYSNMFEEAEVSQKIKDLVKWLKDNWQDILDIVEAIGLSLLTWKIASGVMDVLNKLGFGRAAGAIEATAGLIITVIGVTLAFKGGYEIGSSDGVNLMDVIKAAVGVGLAGIGGAMIAKGITAMGFGSIGAGTGFIFGIAIGLAAVAMGISVGVGKKVGYEGHAELQDYIKGAIGAAVGGTAGAIMAVGAGAGGVIGFVIGVAISLLVTAISVEVGKQKASIERATEFLEEYDGQLAEIMNRQVGYIVVSEEAWKKYDATIGELSYAKHLADQLDILAGKETLSNTEMAKAQALMDELDNLNLDGIKAEWDETHSKIVLNKDAIYDTIEAMKQQAKQAAYTEILTEAYKDQFKTQQDIATAQRMVEDATKALNDRCEELGITYEDVKDNGYMVDVMLKDEVNALDLANKALDTATDNYDKSTDAVKDAEKALDNYIDEVSDVRKETKLTSDQINALKGSFINVGGTKVDLYSVQQSFQNAGWSAQDAANRAWNLYNAVKNLNGMKAWVTITANTVATAALGIGQRIRASLGLAEGGFVPGFANGGWIPSFASGGINSASLFMAHENNAPELVGRIGNHTAVANTSQMVDAMAQGVYRAMSEVMGSGGNVEVNVTLDGQRIARAVDNANRVRNRRFNVQA